MRLRPDKPMRKLPSKSLWFALSVSLFTASIGSAQKPAPSTAQPPDPDAPTPPEAASTNRAAAFRRTQQNTNDPIARIRNEGLNHSQVMQTLSYLSDVIGPRLTGSPNLKRANDWTREKLTSWGLTNSHLEAWGPFGRGWSLKRFSAQVIEPQTIPLIAYPNAWSPGLSEPLVAEVVYFNVKTNSDLEKYKGKLKGSIVLATPPREVKARFEPLANRVNETNLLRLANAAPPRTFGAESNGFRRFRTGSDANAGGSSGFSDDPPATNTTRTAAVPQDRAGARGRPSRGRYLSFLQKEGAALVVSASSQGDGGTLFVSDASVPTPEGRGTNSTTNVVRVWAANAPAIPPQMTVATEDYNRLVRMIEQGEKLKMAVDLQVQFHNDDPMAYNTVAEIPGTDLKEEIVMLGAHMDSWHSGTGATDNGAGVAATMEAMRILAALKLQPRRTIRIGLWSGEEQGLMGSHAYVSNPGGTDHQSFDAIGLPGFQFIQDPIEYSSRTHHSNEDVFDRIQADDLKQAATILAAFAYNAAMLDEQLPRKALE